MQTSTHVADDRQLLWHVHVLKNTPLKGVKQTPQRRLVFMTPIRINIFFETFDTRESRCN